MAKKRKNGSQSDGAVGCLLMIGLSVVAGPAIYARSKDVPWGAIEVGYGLVAFAATLLVYLYWVTRAGGAHAEAIAARDGEMKRRAAVAAANAAGLAQAAAETPITAITMRPVAGDVLLHYHDRNGAETRDRLVTLRQAHGFTTQSGVFVADKFTAYCHTRHSIRTFSITHVIEAADPETGEIIPNLQDWIRAQLPH